jgi:hypothetical protein
LENIVPGIDCKVAEFVPSKQGRIIKSISLGYSVLLILRKHGAYHDFFGKAYIYGTLNGEVVFVLGGRLKDKITTFVLREELEVKSRRYFSTSVL